MAIIKKKQVVILDDDETACQILRTQLNNKGYRANYHLYSGELFEYIEKDGKADLFILDYALSGDRYSGLDVCRRLKAQSKTPIVMLTGNRQVETVVSCIAAGADLYIEKPYELESFTARLSAIIRVYALLNQEEQDSTNLSSDLSTKVIVNRSQRVLQNTAGNSVSLTEKEMAFYEIISGRESLFISREDAYLGIYGRPMEPMNRAIDNLACRIRSKLKELNVPLELYVIRGAGYKLIERI